MNHKEYLKQKKELENKNPTQPKESWEEKWLKLLLRIISLKDPIYGASNMVFFEDTKIFIKNLLEEERNKIFTDVGMNSACEYWYEKGGHDNIIDISSWKNLGEKRGYFKFFKENLNVRHEVDPKTGEIKRINL